MRSFERKVPKLIQEIILNREGYHNLPQIAPLWSAQLEEIQHLFEEIQTHIPNIVYLEQISKYFSDVLIIGDIHGDIKSLLKIIEPFLQEQVESLVFLGDYVDRGNHNLHCLLLIIALSIAWPDRVIVLRGNHEDVDINQLFGFYQELEAFFPITHEFKKVITSINEIYNNMSLIAITPNHSICLHAGIPKNITNLRLLHYFPKPHYKFSQNFSKISQADKDKVWEAFVQVRWNDPTEEYKFPTARSYHGYFYYNRNEIIRFLEENQQHRIIKSHESLRGGFDSLFDSKLFHIFSTEPYDHKIEKAFVIHESPSNQITLRDLNFNQVKILNSK
ncbi:metallophosphoesterase family protein [Candidatus Lokiarchaeum ossiferum]|uniref:metallophosphoesterase family protein n=1 Tax=Candidatus Lokiarchaeum ossiferum TaxID=2951803 RepID=UPI00352F0586